MTTFAFINEIWSEDVDRQTKEKIKKDGPSPLCNLVSDNTENREDSIMTTYLDNGRNRNRNRNKDDNRRYDIKLDVEKKQKGVSAKTCFDFENIVGYEGENFTLLENAFSFDNYYRNNITDKTTHDSNIVSKDSVFKDIVFSEQSGVRERTDNIIMKTNNKDLIKTIEKESDLKTRYVPRYVPDDVVLNNSVTTRIDTEESTNGSLISQSLLQSEKQRHFSRDVDVIDEEQINRILQSLAKAGNKDSKPSICKEAEQNIINHKSKENYYMTNIYDLVLYIISGVFIIIILEQILNLGLLMRD